MSDEDGGNRIQPLRLSVMEHPEQSPSPSDLGGLCKIEPLDPAQNKRKCRTNKSYEEPKTNLESIPQLEQQSFRPDEKSAVSSTSYNSEDLKCTICGAQYNSNKASYYVAHMNQHMCPICKKSLPFHEIVNHVKLHLVNRSSAEGKLDIPCPYCRKHFKTLSNYNAHVDQVHRCPVCGKCMGKKEVIDHIRNHFGADGTIKLDNASSVQAIIEQGQGDRDEERTDTKGMKRKREGSDLDENLNDEDDDDGDDDDDEEDSQLKKRLVVKIQKSCKKSPEAKNLSEDEEEEDDEEDDDMTDIKEEYSDVDDDDDDDEDDSKGSRKLASRGQRSNIKQEADADKGKSSANNQNNVREKQVKKEGNQDEDIELSGCNLEELDGDSNDNGLQDSMFEDLQDEDDGGESNKKSIKLARAQYIADIADRMSTLVKGNRCTMCGVTCQYPNRIRKHVRKVHYCHFCDEFFSRDNLPIHLREHDGPGKKHFCQFCGEQCLSAQKLHYHDCSFEKKSCLFYHCKICQAKLTSKDGLIMHLRDHDPSDFAADWEKNMCLLCGFVFLGRPNLVRHMQSRACTHCGLQTVSSCQHQKHTLSNHHSSAYQCTSCEVQFLSQHSYVDHVTERQCSGCHDVIEPSCEYLKHESLCKTGRERSSSTLELLCLKCDAILTDTYVYDCHVRDHSKFPGKYYCKSCDTQFAQNRDYGIHMSKRKCPQCLGRFQPMCKWSSHTCFRIEPPSVSCPDCNKFFLKVVPYRKHCKMIRCNTCPQLVFSSVCTYNRHCESEHDGANMLPDEPETAEKVEFKCRVKEERTSDQEDMDEDDDLLTPNVSNTIKLCNKGCDHCDDYKGPISHSKLRRHLGGATCQICKEHISPFCKMTKHYVQCAYNLAPSEKNKALLSNDGTQPVHCPLCGQSLQTINGLKSHLRMIDYTCKDCGEKFPATCVFRLHQQKTRHGRQDNICPVCSKGFQYSRDLKKHLLIHTGERPYGCLLCGNSYRNPGHLSYHLKVQHGGARPYKCKYCGRGFGALSGCNKHEKRHEKESDHKCDHCGMMFVAAHSLTKHLATKVCLITEQDGPRMLPNFLEDQNLTMDVKHELLENHVKSLTTTIHNETKDDSDQDPDFVPQAAPSSSILSAEKKTRQRKGKPRPKSKKQQLNHDATNHNHEESFETPIIKVEPLSE